MNVFFMKLKWHFIIYFITIYILISLILVLFHIIITDEYMRKILAEHFKNLFMLYTFIFLIIIVLSYVIINKDFIKPLEEITSFLNRLAKRFYGEKLFVKSTVSEIKNLTETANILSQKLKNYFDELIKSKKEAIYRMIEYFPTAAALLNKEGTQRLIKNKHYDKLLVDKQIDSKIKELRRKMLKENRKETYVEINGKHYKYVIAKVDDFLMEIFYDITYEKEMELCLKEQLKRIQEIDMLKKKLIYNVFHEIRTPLTTIFLALNVLREKYHNEKFINVIWKSVIRINDIVEKILQLFILEENVKEYFEKIRIRKLVEEVIKEYEEDLRRKNVKIIIKIDKSHEIYGCYRLLKIALKELIENSIKFNRPGGLIEITSEKVDNKFKIILKDTGIGIPKDILKEITEPLYQTKDIFKGKPRGLGIGLSLVKRILEMHETKLHIRSEVNKGSEFFFYLKSV